jgi:4-hydroxybenzoate polyprenyltransferase
MRHLALSTHPGPAVAVTAVTAILGFGVGMAPWRIAILTLAMLLGQASVGLSNDWIDADRDRAVGRTDKPVALGLISARTVGTAAFVTAALALALTGFLGLPALAVHAVFILSAWSYNLGLKKTVFSVVPYLVSFGLLPLLVTASLAPPHPAQWWALGAGALLGASAHFANVLPDLADDERTGVRGLPHRLGLRASGVIVAAALAAASILLARTPLLWVGLAIALVLAVVSGWLALTRPPTRLLFRLIMGAALVDVVMLALSGTSLLA